MNELLRWTFLIYFITHIPITFCVDLQGLFPGQYPQMLQDLLQWYIDTYNDNAMRDMPAWFTSFVIAEMCMQLPFFFVATYGFLFKKNWIRIPSIVYGAHVSTTLLPILLELHMATNVTYDQKVMLYSFYAPYLIIPALLCAYMCFVPLPFGGGDSHKKKN